MQVKKITWKNYEQLAATIYTKLEPTAVVIHNDKIYGHDSKTDRQIDVSIRSKIGGHDILTIVQVRDRNRAPDVNAVGEFVTVIRDVRAQKGVIVCRIPAGRKARTLADAYGIDICSAFNVNDHKWAKDVAVPVVVTLLEGELHPDFTFASGSNITLGFPHNTSRFVVSTDEGQTKKTLLDYMNDHVIQSGLLCPGEKEFVVQDDNLQILLNGKEWVSLPHLLITATTKARKLFRHCEASEYLALKNYSTGNLSVAELKVMLPPFSDESWQDGTNVEAYEHVTEDVPAVLFQHSKMRPRAPLVSESFPYPTGRTGNIWDQCFGAGCRWLGQ